MNAPPATTVGPKEDSRGLSYVQGLLLGSVTHKVMQLAEIAVLVARGPIPWWRRSYSRHHPVASAQA